jgi:uncharacterized membrane-anchored protein
MNMQVSRRMTGVVAFGCALPMILSAQAPESKPAAPSGPKIQWQETPGSGKLGAQAEIKLPEGYLFTGGEGTRKFLEITENIPSGEEQGMFIPKPQEGKDRQNWFVIFEYKAVGYVKDEEKDKLDADALLKSLQEGTEHANEDRKKRGWPTLQIVSWSKAPFYDPKTHNLTWGTLLKDSNGQESINYTTRMLGRGGYMQVDLVTGTKDFDAVVADYEKAMAGFAFVQGQRYAEFKKGDKIAAIGLTALVAGGAGAVLAKSGLLGKLWKFIVVGIGAVVTWFKRLFGKKDNSNG